MKLARTLFAAPLGALLLSLPLTGCLTSAAPDSVEPTEIVGEAASAVEPEPEPTFAERASIYTWSTVSLSGDVVFTHDTSVQAWLAGNAISFPPGPLRLEIAGSVTILPGVKVTSQSPLLLQTPSYIEIGTGGTLEGKQALFVKAQKVSGGGKVIMKKGGFDQPATEGNDGADGANGYCDGFTRPGPKRGEDGKDGANGGGAPDAGIFVVHFWDISSAYDATFESEGLPGQQGGKGGDGGKGGNGIACAIAVGCDDGATGGKGGNGGNGGKGGKGGSVTLTYCVRLDPSRPWPAASVVGGPGGNGGLGGKGGDGGARDDSGIFTCVAGERGTDGNPGGTGEPGGPGSQVIKQLKPTHDDC